MRLCSVTACGRKHKAKGYCEPHYLRLLRNGDVGDAPLRPSYDSDEPCRNAGCTRVPIHAKGLCFRCYSSTPEAKRYQRDYVLKKKYNLSLDEILTRLASQNFQCCICSSPIDETCNVDHDHGCCKSSTKTCGECVRGLLCGDCNRALGLFRDSTENLNAAIKYLDYWKAKHGKVRARCGAI
ncbi:endonuclease VII [Mycobacterium phage Gabriela]|nr:endonuclease VII [Mycobacterium phage Gabriela]